MKIMFIAVPNKLEGNIKEKSSFANRITPLELASIGAVLEKKHDVRIIVKHPVDCIIISYIIALVQGIKKNALEVREQGLHHHHRHKAERI